MSNTKIVSEEMLKQAFLTEKEINLLCRRANNPETQRETLDALNKYESWKITPEQTTKGLDWLNNQRRTPRGVERKNNPFGSREEGTLDDFQYFTFDGLYDAGNVHHRWYAPIYTVHGRDSSFQYVIKGGGIEIIG
jgi:hypothetical protein